MKTIVEHTSLGLWETRLAQAARSFVQHLASTGTAPKSGGRELEATLLRLGFSTEETLALSREPGSFCRIRVSQMKVRLRHELDALARRARAGRFDYDLNRHIVVHRASVQLSELTGQSAHSRGSATGAKRARRARRSSSTAALDRASIRR